MQTTDARSPLKGGILLDDFVADWCTWRDFALALLDGTAPGVVRIGGALVVPADEAAAWKVLHMKRGQRAPHVRCDR